MTNFIDTHCHLTFDDFASDFDAVLKRSIDASVTAWITVGTDPVDNNKAIQLAKIHKNLYAAVGIHPHEAKSVTAQTITRLIKIAADPNVVAIGETGLDLHYNFSHYNDQHRAFAKQLQIASQLKLPVIVHSREAFEQTLETIDRFASSVTKIVFHCFTGDATQAKTILDKGFYISLTGAVTFKNAQTIKEAAKIIPLDRLMLETDCPYMSPEPVRKQRPSEPALLIHTAKFLANLKNTDLDTIARHTTQNAASFFALPSTS